MRAGDTKQFLGYVSNSSLVQTSESNFKVVVRVRPPLARELPTEKDENGQKLEFIPITSIHKVRTKDNIAFVLNVQEYLGTEITERGRQNDVKDKRATANH